MYSGAIDQRTLYDQVSYIIFIFLLLLYPVDSAHTMDLGGGGVLILRLGVQDSDSIRNKHVYPKMLKICQRS